MDSGARKTSTAKLACNVVPNAAKQIAVAEWSGDRLQTAEILDCAEPHSC